MGSASGVDVVPLSPGQERIWTSTQIRPDDPFFTIPFVIDAQGPLDAVLMKACLDHLVRRHASLRSTIALRDGELCQVIGAEMSFDWFRGAVLDLEGTAPDQRDDRAAEEVSALAREPFDLATGPLLRAQLIRFGDRRHRLVVTVHHIVFDGWSLTLLVNELGALYEANGDPEATFPGPTPDYASHARRQRIDAQAHAQAVAYWSGRLAGAPGVVELPTERVRPVTTDHRGARYTRVVPVDEVAQWRAVARAGRATMFMLLKAACDVVISHYGTHDVVMGVALAGRDRIESQGLVGYLAQPVVLRSDLGQDPSFRQVLASVRGDLLDAHEHPELPFDAVLQDLGAARDPSYHQPYQIMFAYSDERSAQQAGDIVLSVTELPPDTMKVELSIVLTDTAGGLRCDIDYREDLFAEEDVKRIVDRLEAVLAQVAADPDTSVSGLRRLSEVEYRSAVDEPTVQRGPGRTTTVGSTSRSGAGPMPSPTPSPSTRPPDRGPIASSPRLPEPSPVDSPRQECVPVIGSASVRDHPPISSPDCWQSWTVVRWVCSSAPPTIRIGCAMPRWKPSFGSCWPIRNRLRCSTDRESRSSISTQLTRLTRLTRRPSRRTWPIRRGPNTTGTERRSWSTATMTAVTMTAVSSTRSCCPIVSSRRWWDRCIGTSLDPHVPLLHCSVPLRPSRR